MALDFIDTFMASIRRLESGSFSGSYSAQGTQVTSGQYAGERAYGAYQIMPGNWSGWSKMAGIPGADIRDRRAQDIVARHMFTRYYNRYQDWGLVAIAWFAGGSRADTAMANGVGSVAHIKDANGYAVSQYYTDIQKYMRNASDAGYGPDISRQQEIAPYLDPQARESLTREIYNTPYYGGGGNVPVPPTDGATAAVTPGEVTFANPSAPAPPSVAGFLPPSEPGQPPSQMRPLLVQMMSDLSNLVAGGQRAPVGAPVPGNRIELDQEEEVV